MKKLFLLLVALFFVSLSNAQDYSVEEIEVVQNLFGMEKKAIIEENIDLSGVNSDAFWKLYDQYEVERKELGKQKLNLLHQYTTKTGAVSPQQANELLGEAVRIRTGEDKLILGYTKKISKATNSVIAGQFYQIEHYISDGIRFSILDNIDFIQDKK